MLNKLFNYLKSKHLPSSIAAKNRLYLERDMKSRRIVANFGATFRNSKWSDYSLTNVNLKHKSSFLTFIKNIIIPTFLVFILYSYYLYTDTWLIKIVFSYLSSMVSFVYIWYLYAYFMTPILLKTLFTFAWSSVFRTSFYSPLQDSYTTHLVTNVPTSPHSIIQTDYSTDLSRNYLFVKPLFNSIKQLTYFNNFDTTLNSLNPLFNIYQPKVNSQTLTSIHEVNHNLLQKLVLKNKNIQAYQKGVFHFSNSNWHFISTILVNSLNRSDLASTIITNQLANVKTLRWSYRYSMLHRHLLRGSIQLTSTKKLLSPGFFDSTSNTNNFWFSANYTDLIDSHSSNYVRLLYPSLYSNPELNFSKNSSNLESFHKLLLVNSYETSFYFYLKRIFNFNTLSSHSISSNMKLSNLNFTDESSFEFRINSVLKSTLPRSIFLTNGLLNPIMRQPIKNLAMNTTALKTVGKDVSLLNCEWDVLLNEQLESMLNLSATLPSSKNFFYHFIMNLDKIELFDNTTLNFISKNTEGKISSPFSSRLLNSEVNDSIILNDLLLIELINKHI